MSDIVIPWLGYLLMTLAVLLLLIPGWPFIKNIRVQWPPKLYLKDNEAKTVVKKEVQLDLVKLLHEGKDIQAKLKRVQIQWSPSEQVSAEIHFEAWFTDVSNTLKNTEFLNLWYENKVVNYRKDSISDYIGASERALDRLESIMQLIVHKVGSRT